MRLEKLSAASLGVQELPSEFCVRPSSRRPSFVDRVICSCLLRHSRQWGKRANGSEGGKERRAELTKEMERRTDRFIHRVPKETRKGEAALFIPCLHILPLLPLGEWHDWHGTCHVRPTTMPCGAIDIYSGTERGEGGKEGRGRKAGGAPCCS